jgi:anaerobic magnesium-protoporphyrin IX monomethyl ester cyclase
VRIAVLNPPFLGGRFSRTSRSPAINKSGTLYWPFWLAFGTGSLEAAGHEVLFLDCPAAGIDEDSLVRQVSAFRPRMIVIDTSTPSIYSDLAVASRLRGALPDSAVILVGTHCSALPEECLRLAPTVTGVAVGEYDHTLVQAAEALEGGDLCEVPGMVVNRAMELIRTPERPPIHDLDSLPFLADVYRRHLVPEHYFFAAARYPSVMTITSRGCPFRCSFCVWPQVMHRGLYRTRSAGNVAAEFQLIAKAFPQVREVVVEDDTFSADSRRVEEVSEALIGAGNRLPWTANVRATISLDAMRKMKAAGCRLIIVGYESGSQEVLDRVTKGTTVEQNLEFAARARKAGLLVHGCFMAGNPGETGETLEQTLSMAMKLRPDTAQFFPIMAYPGTRLFDEFQASGSISTSDFSKWVTPEGLHNCVVNLPGLPAADLVSWCDGARKRFYLRPSYLLYKAVQTLAHPLTEGRRTLRAFRTFRKYLFRR